MNIEPHCDWLRLRLAETLVRSRVRVSCATVDIWRDLVLYHGSTVGRLLHQFGGDTVELSGEYARAYPGLGSPHIRVARELGGIVRVAGATRVDWALEFPLNTPAFEWDFPSPVPGKRGGCYPEASVSRTGWTRAYQVGDGLMLRDYLKYDVIGRQVQATGKRRVELQWTGQTRPWELVVQETFACALQVFAGLPVVPVACPVVPIGKENLIRRGRRGGSLLALWADEQPEHVREAWAVIREALWPDDVDAVQAVQEQIGRSVRAWDDQVEDDQVEDDQVEDDQVED